VKLRTLRRPLGLAARSPRWGRAQVGGV